MPDNPTVLSFPWKAGAAKVRLVHGGMGLGQWNHDVCLEGTLLTGIFNYGIPGLFLLAGSALESTKWFKEILADNPRRSGGPQVRPQQRSWGNHWGAARGRPSSSRSLQSAQ